MSTEQNTSTDDRLQWFKSSYSGSGGGDCVEVAIAQHTIHIRDSKNADGPRIHVSARAWSGFLTNFAGYAA